MTIDRRRCLGGAASLGALLGCAPDEAMSPGALGAPFGVPRPDQAHLLLSEAERPAGVLELFLLGGMSPWETFYVVPEYGKDAGDPRQWNTFQARGRPTLPEFMAKCGAGRAPYEPWMKGGVPRQDALGTAVNLGPFVAALRDRPDLLARMRVWVMAHSLEPHEAAIPLAITGLPRGNPRQAALGTHVQRYFTDTLGPRGVPYSYVVYQSSFAVDNNGDAASAVGLHRAVSRPMAVHIQPGSPLALRLPRPTVSGFRDPLDALVQHYTRRFEGRLSGLRAPGLSDFDSARAALAQHEALARLLPTDVLEPGLLQACHSEYAPSQIRGQVLDETTASIGLATRLLTAPTDAARYVQVIEGGIFPDPEGQGYDSHAWHIEQQGINMMHMARVLSDNVNRPGEGDPRKLELDRHFVLLNTEFGRTPTPEVTVRNPQGFGTNHWPWGYVVVGFGSFVSEDRSGFTGAIGPDSLAVNPIDPTAHRAAMLLAMGIWPFHEAAFAVGDIRGASDEVSAAAYLRQRVLGVGA